MANYPGTSTRTLGGMEVYALARKAGFPASAAVVATAIAAAESGWNSNSFNGTAATGDYSIGLWQINLYGSLRGRLHEWGLTDERQLLDPLTNAQAAYRLYKGRGGGFQDWTTYTSGAYASHMSDAQANTVPDAAVGTYVTTVETPTSPNDQGRIPANAGNPSGQENIGNVFGQAGGALIPGVDPGATGAIGGAIGGAVGGAVGFMEQLAGIGGVMGILKLLFAAGLAVFGLLFLFHKQVTTAGKIGAMAA